MLHFSALRHVLYLIGIFATLLLPVSCTTVTSLRSPDGNITVTFDRNDSILTYSVSVGEHTIIAPSQLGIIADQLNISPKAELTVSFSSLTQQWTQPWGENKTNDCNYNEMLVTLTDTAATLSIRFRAFNDGIAFRYEYFVPMADTVFVTDELTEFNLPAASQTWSIPASFETYELDYRHLPIDSISDANTPFTLLTPQGIYASVHEAALYDYPEMTLRRNTSGLLAADLAPLPDGVKAYTPASFVTPWRTVQIADCAVGLINSSLILNLNEPSRILNTSWIKPQKYVGVWWGMHLGTHTWTMGPRHGATTAAAIDYINFAADNNLQGVLFEGWNVGWENWGGNQHFDYLKPYRDFDLDSIASYARRRGIELWMHNETGGNIPEYEAVMDSAFAFYHSLGIHTLKTGYAGGFAGGQYHHSQYGVQHYQRVVETAARYQLMVDAHEPIKDTGIRRTWPNMMTREGARGMEWNAWSEGNSATYLCILPFTRLLSGPMDYTPGIFDIDYSRARADKGRLQWNGPNEHCRIKTTMARQIANWVIIYSPLQMAADLIENYRDRPEFQFFRDFNADCDSSRALMGEIGQYIVVMRRAADRFYIGAGTDSTARNVRLPLSFLEPGVTYMATVYADSIGNHPSPHQVVISSHHLSANDTIDIKMAPAGGQAITFLPLK